MVWKSIRWSIVRYNRRSKRLEALTISLEGAQYSGSIQYQSHVQDLGWQKWVSDGVLSGTTGRSNVWKQ